MNTRGSIRRNLMRRRVRRKGRRSYQKKTSSFLPWLLVILLIFNISVFYHLVSSGNINKDITIFDLVLDSLKIREIPQQEADKSPLESSPEDRDGYKISEERIIDRLEEYENFIIVEKGDSNLDNLPDPINVKEVKLDESKEYILAYHTHTTESFLSEDGKNYNSDTSKNVVSIGNTIATVLEAKGHKVKHDTTVHDLPSFNQSYSRSRNTISKNLKENPNLKFLIDIHRDGRDKGSPNLDAFIKAGRIDIDGVSNATFALVIGPDTENYEQVLSLAKYIKAVSDTMYPGLCRGIIIKPVGKYNLNFSDHSILLEMGSNWTTLEETIESGKKVGEILSVVFDKLIVK